VVLEVCDEAKARLDRRTTSEVAERDYVAGVGVGLPTPQITAAATLCISNARRLMSFLLNFPAQVPFPKTSWTVNEKEGEGAAAAGPEHRPNPDLYRP
jgi:hypothetical protein